METKDRTLWQQRVLYLKEETEIRIRTTAEGEIGRFVTNAWQTFLHLENEAIYDAMETHGFLLPTQREMIPLVQKGIIKTTAGKPLTVVNWRTNTKTLRRISVWMHLPTFEEMTKRCVQLKVTKQSAGQVAVAMYLNNNNKQ